MKVEDKAKGTSTTTTTNPEEEGDEDRFDRERDTAIERSRFHRNIHPQHNNVLNFAEWALFMDRTSQSNTPEDADSNTTYLEEKANFWYSSSSSSQQQMSSPSQRDSRAILSTANTTTSSSTPKVSVMCHPHLIQEHVKRRPSVMNQMERDIASADPTINVLADILDDLPMDHNLTDPTRSTDILQNSFPRAVSLSADFFNRADELAVSTWIDQQRQSTPTATIKVENPKSTPLQQGDDDPNSPQQEGPTNYTRSPPSPSRRSLLHSNPYVPNAGNDSSRQQNRSSSPSSPSSATTTATTSTVPFHNIRIIPYNSSRGIPKTLQLVIEKYWQRMVQATTDSTEVESLLFEFWDEIFPHSKTIAYHDGQTPVPRLDALETFLTTPCPRHIGIVQCEIERIKVGGKKNVKGRFFPTYEYNLFIRDGGQSATETTTPAQQQQQQNTSVKQQVLLMRAKNCGRSYYHGGNHSSTDHHSRLLEETTTTTTTSSSPATTDVLHRRVKKTAHIKPKKKRGVNNYFLYMEPSNSCLRSTSEKLNETRPTELGRLQSNLLGTEFQIFAPRKSKFCRSSSSRERYDSTGNLLQPVTDAQAILTTPVPTEGNGSRSGRVRNTSDRSTRYYGSSWPLLKISSRHNRRAIAQDELPAAQHCSESTDVFNESLSHMGREIETGVITYTANLLGNRPRVMDVCIPKPPSMLEERCDDGSDYLLRCPWETHCQRMLRDGQCEPIEGDNLMLTRFRQLQEQIDLSVGDENLNDEADEPTTEEEDFGLLVLQNRPPWWNEDLGAFVLNFGGRVSVASVKNFQLCDRNDHDYVMLQFGRIQGRHSFTMDFQYPLTAVQAFAIAISSLQSKISLG